MPAEARRFAPLCVTALLAVALLPLISCGTLSGGKPLAAAEQTRADSALPLPMKIAWIFPLINSDMDVAFRPMEYASPSVFGSRIYIGQSEGRFFALAESTGREIWRFDAFGPVEGSAAADKDTVIFGDSDGVVYCLNAKNGLVRWSASTVGEIMGKPVIADGRVYFATTYNRIYCYNLSDGHWVWTHQRDVPATFTIHGLASPVLRNGILYVSFSDGYVAALRAESGKEIWKNLLKLGERLVDVDATPLLDGDDLYIAAYDGDLYKMGTESGDIRWMMKEGESVSRPVLAGDYLYVSSSRGFVMAVDKNTGKRTWETDIREADSSRSLAPSSRLRRKIPTGPVLMKDILLVASNQEYLYALDAKTGAIRWRYHPGNGVTGDFAVSGDRVYFLGNAGQLFAMSPTEIRDSPRL